MRKIISLVVVMIIIVCSCYSISGESSIEPGGVAEVQVNNSHEHGNYNEEVKSGNIRSVVINDKKHEVKYQYTKNIKNTSLDERNDSYGTYDIYVDNEGTEFSYLHNTNILCSMIKGNAYQSVFQVNAIKEDVAKENASRYMKTIMSNFESYDFDYCFYDDNTGVYSMCFINKLSGIKTDDAIYVWVSADGEISAFSMFYRDRYEKYKDIAIDLDKNELDFKKQMDNMINCSANNKYKVNNGYISLDDSGKLVYVREVEITKYQDSQVLTSMDLINTEIVV